MNLVVNICKKRLTKTEVDKMKQIVFSKLWEYSTYYKVDCVCFQKKRFGRVYMNQEWGNCERSIQRFKCIINFNSPRNKLILLSQTSKGGHYWIILGNEISTKVGNPRKHWTFQKKEKSSLVNNGLNLTRIHANVISKDGITQKFHFRLMEFTLF